jgi:hypothetical protein
MSLTATLPAGLGYTEDFVDMDGLDSRKLSLVPVFSGGAFRSIVDFPVIVEAWDHKRDGLRKRRWLAEFNESERKRLGSWHGKFYRWYLIDGTPHHVKCKLSSVQLLQRACNFFATI